MQLIDAIDAQVGGSEGGSGGWGSGQQQQQHNLLQTVHLIEMGLLPATEEELQLSVETRRKYSRYAALFYGSFGQGGRLGTRQGRGGTSSEVEVRPLPLSTSGRNREKDRLDRVWGSAAGGSAGRGGGPGGGSGRGGRLPFVVGGLV